MDRLHIPLVGDDICSAILESLIDNQSLLQVIMENQARVIAEEDEPLFDEVLKQMDKRFQEIRKGVGASVIARWGKPDVVLDKG